MSSSNSTPPPVPTEAQLKLRVEKLENNLSRREERITELERQVEELHLAKKKEVEMNEKDKSLTKWDATTIRQTFIDFFTKKKDHDHYRACPVVPLDDPTLLFINAGMNQYKPIFLGQVDPSNPMARLKRACNSQKCIRAGGKHNDLDDVGKDVYHHTFFEMLGNWSFGNYFKKEAVAWAWELLTTVYKLDSSRLYATYFGGDIALGLESDEETRQLWLQYLPSDRILPFGCKDNFWEMGDVGPCGPCTEIHYDRIGNRHCPERVNADHPDVIEIWNVVFIQYNRGADSKLSLLPNKHVDTGMGFERLASILQGKMSNYDTDVFQPIFGAIRELTNAPEYTGRVGEEDHDNKDMAYRVVADHIRTLTFAITDGAIPSNDGRGYVLRRILRRAVRYGEQILGAKNGFLTKLVPVVVSMLSNAFPELREKQAFVEEIILDEEKSFGKTLNKGIERFRKTAHAIKAAGGNEIPGEDAFFLYDSMGFPFDLTQLMAEEIQMTVDVKGYEAKMKEQTERSKMDRKLASGIKPLVLEAKETSQLQKLGITPTVDKHKYEPYSTPTAKVVAIFTHESGFVDSSDCVAADASVGIILDRTSFYAQSGGQIYDTGVLISSDGGISFRVDAVESYAGYVLHMGPVETGVIKVGQDLSCMVNYQRRDKIAPNHTMTHVLNFALRKVLGTIADQRGSLVDETRLRFDFTNNKSLTTEQIEKVEELCKNIIKQELDVYTKTASQASAKRIQGLRAVFGETYPDFVRVVSIGSEISGMLEDPENSEWANYSVEFCGGTHLTNTREAKEFVLFEESSIAKGIRRISACTGEAAFEAEKRAQALSDKLEPLFSLKGNDLAHALSEITPEIEGCIISLPRKKELRTKLKELENEVKKFHKQEKAERATKGLQQAELAARKALENNEVFVILSLEVGTDAKLGREMLETMSKAHPEGGFMILSIDPEKKKTAGFCQISSKLSEQIDARTWVNETMAPLKGKGGGKNALNATGQAKTIEGIEKALEAAKAFVA